MRKIFCDKCKNEIEEKEVNRANIEVRENVYAQLELCEKCRDLSLKYMRGEGEQKTLRNLMK